MKIRTDSNAMIFIESYIKNCKLPPIFPHISVSLIGNLKILLTIQAIKSESQVIFRKTSFKMLNNCDTYCISKLLSCEYLYRQVSIYYFKI